MKLVTILGASGFIGSHLLARLRELGIDCFCPARGEEIADRNLGEVIYCIGLTADFRTRPFDTVEAHVSELSRVLQKCNFDSLLYLSSARVYGPGNDTKENADVSVNPTEPGNLYNISKLMGESLCFAGARRTRVARLSNVYGGDFASENFLSAIIREAVGTGKITLQTSLNSEKDYVSISDVVDLLIRISSSGRERLYNVASGTNVSNRELAEKIRALTDCKIEVAPNAPEITFPVIDIERSRTEFGIKPSGVLDEMDDLLSIFKRSVGRRT
jgi:nucleoside-diphosphate-sugar epimerase